MSLITILLHCVSRTQGKGEEQAAQLKSLDTERHWAQLVPSLPQLYKVTVKRKNTVK